jgi:hypothetical protein
MMERLTNARDELENARRRIVELIGAHGEWFYSQNAGSDTLALSRGELDFRVSHGRLIFSCWSEQGTLIWRVNAWEWASEKLLLEVTRRMGAERATLELVPRASASAISELVSRARRRNCARMAWLACAQARGAKVERASLNPGTRRGQPGRYARIVLRLAHERIAVTGTVDAARERDIDAFLSSALIWFMRKLENSSATPRIQKLWLIVQKESVEPATERIALLRESLRRAITLYEIDDDWQELAPVPLLEQVELWTKHPARFRSPPVETGISREGSRIVALAPDAIDVMRARHGETLRYHGLPFARIRRVMSSERVWFGLDGSRSGRRLLDESTEQEWMKLLRELQEHRRAGAGDHQHALYKALPEAWLESMLRRDITRLDPGLRIAPLHAQFRASPTHGAGSRPIDLLALRRDGRLVVIELKISEDRQHVIQGAHYWQQVEAHRRRGHITRARLFDDAAITDEPPLVYLVAPTLRFHRSFHTLAKVIDPTIEIYRFDINEDWRAGVRVMRRARVSQNA